MEVPDGSIAYGAESFPGNMPIWTQLADYAEVEHVSIFTRPAITVNIHLLDSLDNLATSGTYAFNPALSDAVLNADRLRELLIYDQATGLFTRRVGVTGWAAMTIAGSVGKNGHVYIGIDRRKYLASRLAWLYMTGEWPRCEVDHKNLVTSDNRWSNLRQATRNQNAANTAAYCNNKSGYKGVSWDKQHRKWRAQICIDSQYRNLGLFDTPVEAHAVYAEVAIAARGEFARV